VFPIRWYYSRPHLVPKNILTDVQLIAENPRPSLIHTVATMSNSDSEQNKGIHALDSDSNDVFTRAELAQDPVPCRESDLVTSEFREEILSNLEEDQPKYLLFNTVFKKKKQMRIIDAGDTVYTLRLDLSIFGSQRAKDAPETSYRALSRGGGKLTRKQN